MTLDELQRSLLGLIKGTGPYPDVNDDPYLHLVVSSEGLDAIRVIAYSWNGFSAERLCPLTCRLLRQRGELAAALAVLTATDLPSAFVEDLAVLFLEQQCRGGAPMVADVARFEAAVLRLRLGEASTEMVEWRHDPDVVIAGLMEGRSVKEAKPGGAYLTVVSLNLPGLYQVVAA